MNYTQNYHLPQWVSSDRIMMEDFNDAMSAMESGMTASTAAANEAKADASSARQTAANAQQSVKTWKNYKVGTYTGTTGTAQSVNVGFRPSFLIVSGMKGADSASGYTTNYDRYFVMTGGNVATESIQLTDAGFSMPAHRSHFPDLNEQDRRYDYIAFR